MACLYDVRGSPVLSFSSWFCFSWHGTISVQAKLFECRILTMRVWIFDVRVWDMGVVKPDTVFGVSFGL